MDIISVLPGLGGQVKTDNYVPTPETSEFYFACASVRKSVWILVPASRPAFEDMRVMQQAIEQRGDSRRVAQ